jgi:hypothetical protein
MVNGEVEEWLSYVQTGLLMSLMEELEGAELYLEICTRFVVLRN